MCKAPYCKEDERIAVKFIAKSDKKRTILKNVITAPLIKPMNKLNKRGF